MSDLDFKFWCLDCQNGLHSRCKDVKKCCSRHQADETSQLGAVEINQLKQERDDARLLVVSERERHQVQLQEIRSQALDAVSVANQAHRVLRGSTVRFPATYVYEFHETYGAPIRDVPVATPPERWLRLKLLREEVGEYADALDAKDIFEIADALADIVYVAYGAALTHGIDLDAVLREVHRSNMSKLAEDGSVILREDGKVLKGPNYSPPDIASVLAPSLTAGEEGAAWFDNEQEDTLEFRDGNGDLITTSCVYCGEKVPVDKPHKVGECEEYQP